MYKLRKKQNVLKYNPKFLGNLKLKAVFFLGGVAKYTFFFFNNQGLRIILFLVLY